MSHKEALLQAQVIVKKYGGDTEALHGYLDDLLLDILSELGYAELVELFNKQSLWYA